jgi:hypothetical protein
MAQTSTERSQRYRQRIRNGDATDRHEIVTTVTDDEFLDELHERCMDRDFARHAEVICMEWTYRHYQASR